MYELSVQKDHLNFKHISAIALGVLLFPIGIIGCCMLKVKIMITKVWGCIGSPCCCFDRSFSAEFY